MAQVAVQSPQQRTNAQLDSLIEAWRALPEAERSIDRWDLMEQLDYIEEWGAKESLADVLRQKIASPNATDEQRRGYAELTRRMATNRPILDRLRAS